MVVMVVVLVLVNHIRLCSRFPVKNIIGLIKVCQYCPIFCTIKLSLSDFLGVFLQCTERELPAFTKDWEM